MYRSTIVLCLAVSVCLTGASLADIPKLINYQGMLTNDSGDPLTGTYDITFQIYNASSGGDKRWEETQTDVAVTDGLFNVILGGATVGGVDLDFSEEYWLDVTVETDHMPERLKFTSVGYAYRAMMADTATVAVSAPTGGGWTDDGTVVRLQNSTDSVGIGTDAPGTKLHVEGGAFWVYTGGFGGTGCRITGNEIAATGVNPPGSNPLHVKPADNSSSILLAENGGSVGIGTDDPLSKLHVQDSASYVETRLRNGFTNGNSWFVAQNDARQWYMGVVGTDNDKFRITLPSDSNFTIATDGKVGVGITAPTRQLHVGSGGQSPFQTAEGLYVNPNAASAAITAEDNTGVEGGIMAHNNGNVYIGSWSNHAVTFRTNNADVGKIDASGSFGIGISIPTEKLDVDGTAKLRGITEGGVGTVNVVVDATGKLWREGPGNLHKENIRRLGTDPEKVFQLEPVRFNWKTTGVEDIGLIAEDVEKAIPELVVHDDEGRPNGIRYDRITLYLLDVVKDLKAQNDALRSRIDVLEDR